MKKYPKAEAFLKEHPNMTIDQAISALKAQLDKEKRE